MQRLHFDQEKELRAILTKYNLAEKIDRQELKCAHCNQVIKWDHISAFRIHGNNFDLYCDNAGCIEAVANS